MKKLFILLTAMPLLVNAQENKKPVTNKRISLGFSFSPDYNYRTLKNNDGSSSSDYVINSRDDIEKGKISFTTGFNLNVSVSRNIEFQTGLLYSNNGYRSPKRPTNLPSPRPTEATHLKSVTNFNYLNVPLKINVISGKRNVKFIAGTGLTANFLISQSDIWTFFYADGSKKDVDQSDGYDYKKFNLFALVSAGAEFKLKRNMFFRAEPTFRYGFMEIIDMPVTAKLWNVGLNLEVYLKLK